MSLQEYRRKRDFRKTAEPRGGPARGIAHRFVIQKHAASRLHYDFRLELGGALKSWAVPKGIPCARGEKRLAVEVEDHPLSYVDFEGTIPKGQYGGGTVMVWDQGTYEATTKAPAKELASGKLHFTLAGKKLKGEWYLVRLRDDKQWLLIKGGEDQTPVSKALDDTSALSGRTMREIAGGGEPAPDAPPPRAKTENHLSSHLRQKVVAGHRSSAAPGFIEPMKTRPVESPPAGEWIYEVKFDGYRAIAIKDAGEVRLLSRNENDFGAKFPQLVTALSQLDAEEAVIDGEIVALDSKGRSSFQLLQAYELGEKRPPIFYYAFDLLSLGGTEWRHEPLTVRKARLEKLLGGAPQEIRYSASLDGKASDLLKKAAKLGLEGLVGKQKDSTYQAGQRTGAWIKLKLRREQELVIGGYTEPKGGREHLGAVLVGFHDRGGLRFAGKVGTGFSENLLDDLHSRLAKIETQRSPFVDLPPANGTVRDRAAAGREMRGCHWVKPKLVCQVRFAEWTRDAKLRQPVFLGLREDKKAGEVVRETNALA